VFTEISKSLINGQDVKISSFGTFIVRNKKERVGRNPKTGEEVPITARQVVTFRASNVLKSEVSDLSKVDTSIETENR
jgi:integration host factor subunit alpha